MTFAEVGMSSKVITTAQTTFICVGTCRRSCLRAMATNHSIGVRDYGLGRHLWALKPEQIVGFEKVEATAMSLSRVDGRI